MHLNAIIMRKSKAGWFVIETFLQKCNPVMKYNSTQLNVDNNLKYAMQKTIHYFSEKKAAINSRGLWRKKFNYL